MEFTTGTWGTPQPVVVAPVDDDDAHNESVNLTHAVTGYTPATPATVSVSVDDDESVGLAFTPTNRQITITEGETGSYMVELPSQPFSTNAADRTVTVTATAT